MREYDDDNIRLYTPVLQRVIILLAVIIAVPVVMWTITTMVRTYVAPPKAPTFQRMTETQPADTASIAAPAVPATPAATAERAQAAVPTTRLADATETASDARTPLLDIKKPADQSHPVAIAAPPPVAPTPAAPKSPASAAPAKMAAAQPMPATSAPPTPAPGPAAAGPAQPAPSAGPVQVAADSPGNAAAPTPNNIVWPNPNATAPPPMDSTRADTANNPAPGESAAAASQQPASNGTVGDDLPPGEPINGRVPLPPHRPMLFAMVQTAIPLPRPRPADAPAATPATPAEAPGSSYEPGMEPGHY